MGYTIKNNTKYFVKKETTEGVYAAPASGSEVIQVMEDGSEMNLTIEQLEQKVLGQGLAAKANRNGMHSVSGSLNSYLRASQTEGSVPEIDVLLESLFGSKRASSEITSGSGHTTSVINVSSTANLKVGDIVVIKEAGGHHSSPIKAVVENTYIELLVPMDAAPADSVKIAAFTTYVPANSGHQSFSVSKYIEDAIVERGIGCKATTLSVENFTANQIANFNCGFEGLDMESEVEAPAYTPVFQTSESPIIVKSCIFQDGNKIEINEFSLSIENTLSFLTNTCVGRSGSRVTARSVTGSINPFKQNDSVSDFDKFNAGETFSLFVQTKNPTAVEGEFKEWVNFYLPKCKITEMAESDLDGVLQNNLSFQAVSSDGSPEVFLSFT